MNERQLYDHNPLIQYLNFRQPKLFRWVWNAYLYYHRLKKTSETFHPIAPILQAEAWNTPPSVEIATDAPTILIVTFNGWSFHTVFDGLIGRALAMRGARVKFLTCGGVLPICFIHNSSTSQGIHHMPCGRCRSYVESGLGAFGFDVATLHDYVSEHERAKIQQELDAIPDDELTTYQYDGIEMGKPAYLTTRWYFIKDSQLDEEMTPYMRGYLYMVRLAHQAVVNLLKQFSVQRIIVLNGMQATDNTILQTAQKYGIPYLSTERGYVNETVCIAHNDTVTLFPWHALWQQQYHDQPLADYQEQMVERTLQNRRYGFQQMDNLWERIEEDQEHFIKELNLENSGRVISVFTNVIGDTGSLDREMGFKSIFHWLDTIIEYAKLLPDKTFVIRVHPAETRIDRYRPTFSVNHYLRDTHLATLPDNVRIIFSESILSSYTLLNLSEASLVYTSTIGLEASAMGVAVGVSGRVHYADKDFTVDASSPEKLWAWLSLPRLSPLENQVILAKRYLYLMMYRTSIPIKELIDEKSFGQMHLKANGWDDLRYGASPVLDTITDGILYGKPFLNPYADDPTSAWAIASLQ
ncbi:MAG: hypothetical protein ACOYLB_01195 [Phototrophicaceae bacterium]